MFVRERNREYKIIYEQPTGSLGANKESQISRNSVFLWKGFKNTEHQNLLCLCFHNLLKTFRFTSYSTHVELASHSVQFSSVIQSCPTLCNPMDWSIPSFPVHHQHPELAPTYVHRVSDAIQPSHPQSSHSPPSSILPQIRVFFNESLLHIRWPMYWSFSISLSSEYSGLISFRMDWLDLLAVQEISRVFSNTTVQKHQFFGAKLSL